jgi:hypothetical protein
VSIHHPPHSLDRHADDANEPLVRHSFRLRGRDQLEELGMVGAHLRIRRKGGRPEDLGEPPGELRRHADSLHELALRLRQEGNRGGGEVVHERERQPAAPDRIADGFVGNTGGGKGQHQPYPPNVADAERPLRVSFHDAQLDELPGGFGGRPGGHSEVRDAQLPHPPIVNRAKRLFA